MIIEIGQHIYGNVEKDVSPARVGGFQTLFYTREYLSERESEEIEGRLVYYPSAVQPVKLLFFGLSSGKIVISQIVPVADIDRFGRKAGYIAHSFVFKVDDFARIKCNPSVAFHLLKNKFVSITAEALQLPGIETTYISAARLEMPNDVIETLEFQALDEIKKWNVDELKKLAHGAVNYSKMREEQKSFVLSGSPEDIQNTLMVIFLFLPDEFRLNCSFDTYSYGCNPVANYFWALGYPTPPASSPRFIFVNATEKKIQLEIPPPVYPYERWLFASISQQRFSDIVSNRAVALQLQRLLLDESYDYRLLRTVSPNLIVDFLAINWGYVASKAERNLRNVLGPHLAARLSNQILSRYQLSGHEMLLSALAYGFDQEEIANQLYLSLLQKEPSHEEIMELCNLSELGKHEPLAVLVSFWKQDYRGFKVRLDSLPPGGYQEVIELLTAGDMVPLDKLFSAPHANIFFDTFIRFAQHKPQLKKLTPELVKNCIEMDQGNALIRLVPLLGDLELKELTSLRNVVQKREQQVPPVFFEYLDAAIASAKANKSSKGIFKKPIRK